MHIFIAILAFLSAIIILILTHELGHFIAAKIAKVKIERLALGFGKPFLKYKSKSGIQYSLSPILLGGFVKLDEDSYEASSVWRRLIIMLSGVLANIIFAVIIFFMLFTVGIEYLKPVVGKVTIPSIASNAGLKVGEKIRSVDVHQVKDWQGVNIAILSRIGDKNSMTINNHVLALRNWQISKLDPNPLKALGIEPYTPPLSTVIGKVAKNSPAATIGLKPGDKILSINHHTLQKWEPFIKYVHARPDQKVTISIKRGGKKIFLSGKIGSRWELDLKLYGYLGITHDKIKYPSSMTFLQKYPVYTAILPAIKEVVVLFTVNFIILLKLLTGKLSVYILGGPITIFNNAAMALNAGLIAYFSFLALFSIMLAFVNILPIPVLDGGYCLFLLLEVFIGKPIPKRIQKTAVIIGALLITFIMFLAIGNDLLRLFS